MQQDGISKGIYWFLENVLDYCLSLANNTNTEIINGCWEIIGSRDERWVWTNELI